MLLTPDLLTPPYVTKMDEEYALNEHDDLVYIPDIISSF